MFKTKTMALTVAIGLMCSSNLLAQMDNSRPGGLFGSEGYTSKGLMGRSESTVGGYFTGQGFGATNGNLSGQGFGVTNGNKHLVPRWEADCFFCLRRASAIQR